MANTEEKQINELYDMKKASRLKALEDAYRANVQAEDQRVDSVAGTYKAKANALEAQYEKQKRSFNELAAAKGLNTGAASQAALSQQSEYQQGMAGLRQDEARAYSDSKTALGRLESEYKSAVADAIAENDYQRAEALYSLWKNKSSADEDKAKLLAQYGDFSGYAALYGEDIAREMSAMWAAKNPALAYKSGLISEEEYYRLK